MKKLISLLLMATTNVCMMAQKDSTFYKKGDFGFTANLSGLFNGISLDHRTSMFAQPVLLMKYFKNENTAFRFGVGVDLDRLRIQQEDSVANTLVTYDSIYSNPTAAVSFGIEKHYRNNRFDPFFGGEVMLAFIGKRNIESNTVVQSQAGEDRLQRIIKQDGGFGFGARALAGFNYYFLPQFALGVEGGIALMYGRAGGTYSENLISTPISGASSSVFVVREATAKGVDLDLEPGFQFTFSFLF